MRVLAVGAHPDDIEILCAGTLLRYRQQGHQVVVAVATNGEQGHFEIPPAELAAIRRREAERSAEILGAELIWMGHADEFIYHDHATRVSFVEMVRRARPDLTITHNPEDYHTDHRTVSELVMTATFLATVPHAETESPPTARISPLYYMDSLSGAGFAPQEYVDVSPVFADKLRMLECHSSQVKWLREHDGIDLADFVGVMGRFRGLSCGVKHAEGFRRFDAWGRNTVTRMLP